MTSQPNIDGKQIAACVARFRERKPHIHCITNAVAQHFTANVLLSAGATPSMTINPDEISGFVEMADALLINLGTMDDQRDQAASRAVESAIETSKPWVLDPVFVQASSPRLRQARQLLGKGPTLIRCNKVEAQALTDIRVEAADLQAWAAKQNTIVALSGALDTISSAETTIRVANGSAVMDRVTAMGCALTALMAGFLALEDNGMLAATSATVLYGLAGEVAERTSSGPGTFAPAFLDALHTLSDDKIANGAKLS